MRKQFLLFLLFLCTTYAGMTAHIVGAELYYDYQGNNNYAVTLKLYRNCACTMCADYGLIEYVQIFDANGNYLDSIAMAIPPRDTFPDITKPCQQPIDVCIEEAIYTGTINLPPTSGGYTLVYQRCCRNASIQSINNPSGATYVATIPGIPYSNNSSPRFNQIPPIYVCADQYLLFDHSATDPDGDSLSYSLVNALDGASSTCPNPSPGGGGGACPSQASPPPYTSVIYLSPYSAANPTNSPPNTNDLQIDPVSGVLSGIPNQTGIFVVAVAVSEYRNGVYLGQTIRDYQFNIVVCTNPTVNLIYQPGTYNPSTNLGVYTYNCTSDTIDFSNNISFYNPSSTATLTYHWDFGVPGLTNDTSNLPYPIYIYPDTGTFNVTVVVAEYTAGSTGACYDTARGIVIAYPKLKADFSLLPVVSICQDSAELFHDGSTSTSSPLSTWRWSFGDGRTSILQNPSHQYADSGTYAITLTVTNRRGCTATKRDTIRVFPQPVPNFTTSALCIFDNIQFTYTGMGGMSEYYWDFGNGSTSSAMNPATLYTTPGIKTVSLVTVTSHGCRDTIVKQLKINALPVINISPNTIICHFTSTTLSASGGVSYIWTPGSSLSDSVISHPVASPGAATTYTATVTDTNQCVNMASTFVNLYPLPQIDAGPDTSVCPSLGSFHDSVQLQATGGVNYLWTPSIGLSDSTISNPVSRPPTDSNVTYYVTGTDTNGCKLRDSLTVSYLDSTLNLIIDTAKAICDHDTTTLHVIRQGDSYYNWTPNIGISDPHSNSPYFYPDSNTTYIFTVRNYCYQKMDTAAIIVHPLPPLITEGIDSVCIHDTIQLHASGAAVYQWQADPTLSSLRIDTPLAYPIVTDTYYVTGIDTVYGCRKKDSVLVYVYPLPVPEVGPDTAYLCQGKSITLHATGGIVYLWTANSTLNNLNIGDPIAIPLDTTWYYVRVYNIHQCHADDSIKINVQLPVTALAESPYNICIGSPARLSASGGFYYLWTPATWLSSATTPKPAATPDTTMMYTVQVSNDCFSSTAQVEVIVHPLPVVNAGDDTTIYRNTAAILSGSTNGDSVYWYPGMGVTDPLTLLTSASPLYTAVYRLYAISAFGCVNVDSVIISVEPYTLILIPTAFTPNGDGTNDVFRIVEHLNIKSLEEFAVYDRWGQKVFSTDNITEGWNGTYDGRAQDMGTYTWFVKAVTYDGEQVLQKGNITLLR